MATSYFTTVEGITIAANQTDERPGQGLAANTAYAEISFPNAGFDQVTIYRPFTNLDEAKAAAEALAGQVKSLAPRGTHLAWSRPKLWKPGDLAAREAIDRLAREWAGETAVVHEI